MILDQLTNGGRYLALHPGFAAAFEYLQSAGAAEMLEGRHELDGERLFVIVAKSAGRGREGAKLEAHRRYIDIQLCLAGDESIGWRPTADCVTAEAPFDEAKDIVFFTDRPETWLALPPRTFAIFWPEDAHAPLAGEGEVLKAVVKVAVGW